MFKRISTKYLIFGFLTIFLLLFLIGFILIDSINQNNRRLHAMADAHSLAGTIATMRDLAYKREQDLYRMTTLDDTFDQDD